MRVQLSVKAKETSAQDELDINRFPAGRKGQDSPGHSRVHQLLIVSLLQKGKIREARTTLRELSGHFFPV